MRYNKDTERFELTGDEMSALCVAAGHYAYYSIRNGRYHTSRAYEELGDDMRELLKRSGVWNPSEVA